MTFASLNNLTGVWSNKQRCNCPVSSQWVNVNDKLFGYSVSIDNGVAVVGAPGVGESCEVFLCIFLYVIVLQTK